MILSHEERDLFHRLHLGLLKYVASQIWVVGSGKQAEEMFATLSVDEALEARDTLTDSRWMLDDYVSKNPERLSESELAIVSSWRHMVVDMFYVVKDLSHYTVFLTPNDPPRLYGVTSLSTPLAGRVGGLPAMVKTVLLPFQGKVIYDGLLVVQSLSFGPGVKRMVSEAYKQAKEQSGIITSLPAVAMPAPQSEPKSESQPEHTSAAQPRKPRGAKANTGLAPVVDLIEQFCAAYLNEEYAIICRALAEKLSRKRPSPLLQGKPQLWASAIVRTIGWVNFLNDPALEPHMTMAEISELFGVSESASSAKAKLVRKAANVKQYDWQWVLPSLVDRHPLVWMLDVDGFAMDIRRAPLELQQQAYDKGLIPYVPSRARQRN